LLLLEEISHHLLTSSTLRVTGQVSGTLSSNPGHLLGSVADIA
jgi:hypothetical protein